MLRALATTGGAFGQLLAAIWGQVAQQGTPNSTGHLGNGARGQLIMLVCLSGPETGWRKGPLRAAANQSWCWETLVLRELTPIALSVAPRKGT
jgi:hypothetical protein